MTRLGRLQIRKISAVAALGMMVTTPLSAVPSAAATSEFNAYVANVEARLERQHHSPDDFLAGPQSREPSRGEDISIDELSGNDAAALPGALLHHWRGTAFAHGADAGAFEALLRRFNNYPLIFAPQVLTARVLSANGDRIRASMRVRQKHVLTVVLDTDYDVQFGRLNPGHRHSASRSTRIAEIDQPDTPSERALSPAEDHGLLWRQNTYWSWEERDGGLIIQIESVTLTRSIPAGLGWAVKPFVESVPRESLEFTLKAAIKALQHPQPHR